MHRHLTWKRDPPTADYYPSLSDDADTRYVVDDDVLPTKMIRVASEDMSRVVKL